MAELRNLATGQLRHLVPEVPFSHTHSPPSSLGGGAQECEGRPNPPIVSGGAGGRSVMVYGESVLAETRMRERSIYCQALLNGTSLSVHWSFL